MQKTNLISAIVVAGGKGERYPGTENKVLMNFNGKSIFEYSLETFQNSEFVQEIILVGLTSLPFHTLKMKYPKLSQIVPGGEYRQMSVFNGLSASNKDIPLVIIHDAARPFFSPHMIHEMMSKIETCDSVIPMLPIYDAIKEINQFNKIKPHDSKNLYRTQTPQLYKRQALMQAFQENKGNEQFRDEMELLTANQPELVIKSVGGDYLAEKITTQDEFRLLQKLLPKVVQSGIGYDFHPFIPDKALVLGGCEIPFSLGLEGDSDGDVLCHAVLDSLLGALSLGDIGRYIGIKTPQVIRAKSLNFLKQFMNDTNLPFFQILHIDATIICKEPLLNPWIENMVECLADAIKIDKNQINIKSTTDKGVDGAGEGKGIRVISIATIETPQRRDKWQTN